MEISLTDLEQVINYWRLERPSQGEESALSPEVNALATGYALMIIGNKKVIAMEDLHPVARQLIELWREQAELTSKR